jgi:hypothetical protein
VTTLPELLGYLRLDRLLSADGPLLDGILSAGTSIILDGSKWSTAIQKVPISKDFNLHPERGYQVVHPTKITRMSLMGRPVRTKNFYQNHVHRSRVTCWQFDHQPADTRDILPFSVHCWFYAAHPPVDKDSLQSTLHCWFYNFFFFCNRCALFTICLFLFVVLKYIYIERTHCHHCIVIHNTICLCAIH